MSILLIVAILGFFSITYAFALTESEAEAKFQSLGCTNCHKEGGPADDWDELVDEIKAWAKEFPDLDTAVKTELHEDSFEDLMTEMASNAGVSKAQVEPLEDFFMNEFNEAKSAGGGGVAGGFNTTLLLGIVAVIVIVAIIAWFFLRKK